MDDPMEQVMPFVLMCIAHDYALHEVKNATVLARRLVKHSGGQKALAELQSQIASEIRQRKSADDDTRHDLDPEPARALLAPVVPPSDPA